MGTFCCDVSFYRIGSKGLNPAGVCDENDGAKIFYKFLKF